MRVYLFFALMGLILTGWTAPLAADDSARAQKEFLSALVLEYRADGEADFAAAEVHYQLAADLGSREALLALSRLSQPGAPLWKNPQNYLEHLAAASKAGWPQAAYLLGDWLEKYPDLKAELPSPSYYFQAAAAGIAPAARRLGEMYLKGQGELEPDQEQALLWLTVAAENSDSTASELLGRLFYDNQAELAIKWLERAGTSEALYLLGKLFLREKRFPEALDRLTQAADQNYPLAHQELGFINLDNDFGRRPNPREALKHLKIAAQADLPEACYRLAHMYLTGQSTPKDSITGAFWLHRAARGGQPKALIEYEKLIYNFTVGQKKRLERMIEDGITPTTQTQVK